MNSERGSITPNKASLNRRKADSPTAPSTDGSRHSTVHGVSRTAGRTERTPVLPGGKTRVRFTSNVVGSLVLIADVLCFLLSAPIAVAAYRLAIGSELVLD